jgi:hypothetical protein
VRHRLVALERPHGPYPPGSVWADPDLEHAARMMLEVVADPQRAAARGGTGHERVAALYGVEAVATRFRAELERGGRWEPVAAAGARSPAR